MSGNKKLSDVLINNAAYQLSCMDSSNLILLNLALTLYRLGSNGDDATIFKVSCLFGVGDEGTIDRVTKQVFKAIISLERTYLTWPSADERLNIVETTIDELSYCIFDGTEIELAERPTLNGDVYLPKSKNYALKLQGTCDYQTRLRHIDIGYPGSVHDTRIFNNCMIASSPSVYMTEPQWIAADSAVKHSYNTVQKELDATNSKIQKRFQQIFQYVSCSC
ncbi:hypothetical protein HA402_004677 [Bradysia odoriphaga]|nr:hypothetical protein HA402_004677 [Bradysia odoriphaga]